MATVTVWVVVDADGSYTVGTDSDEANEAYERLYGVPGPRRVLCMALGVELPVVVELSGTVPAERVGPVKLTVG